METTRKTYIIQNDSGKFGFNVIDNGVSVFTSEIIYDEIYNLNEHIDKYLELDYIKLKLNGKYGVFDVWNMKQILNFTYSNIDVFQLHNFFIFICQNNNKYQIKLSNGSNAFNMEFDNWFYMGFFENIQKYLITMVNNGLLYVYDLFGNMILENLVGYEFKFFRVENYIVFRKIKTESTDPDLFDVYSTNGNLLFENVTNYNFLMV